MDKLRIIVGGYIGLYPSGGVTWDYIQYPLGLQLLGHDVYYIEDTLQYPAYASHYNSWDDASASVEHLSNCMKYFGLENRWAYRDIASGKTYGIPEDKVKELCKTADLFINISAANELGEDFLNIPIRILIDSDPMFTQVQNWDDKNPESAFESIKYSYQRYTHLFTFGENIGMEDCLIPTLGLQWHPTRQPICLNHWQANFSHSKSGFTTVMNWAARKKIKYNEIEWGQKDIEFQKFIDIPANLPEVEFNIVVSRPTNSSDSFNIQKINENRWNVLEPSKTINSVLDYKTFIIKSKCEFSVAKETYVKSRSGWFSCRSACYLATGRPVITQDTGWSKYYPTGKGLFAFTTKEEAIMAIREVNSNEEFHQKEAIEIAHNFFDSNKVLSHLINRL